MDFMAYLRQRRRNLGWQALARALLTARRLTVISFGYDEIGVSTRCVARRSQWRLRRLRLLRNGVSGVSADAFASATGAAMSMTARYLEDFAPGLIFDQGSTASRDTSRGA